MSEATVLPTEEEPIFIALNATKFVFFCAVVVAQLIERFRCKSSHRQNLIMDSLRLAVENTKRKDKEAENGPFKTLFRFWFIYVG